MNNKRTRRLVIAAVALVVVIALTTVTAELMGFIVLRKTEDMSGSQGAVSILYVGNSHVFVGNLPQQLQTIARAQDVEVTYKDLSRHGNRGGTLRELTDSAISEMSNHQFDYVVLTCNGSRISQDYEGFLKDVRALSDEARARGVVPVLFNAAWTADRANLSIATDAYKRVADELDIMLVNAADAWVHAYQEIPDASLITGFDLRGPHANKAGGFLTACVFAAILFNLHVKDIPKDNHYKGSDAIGLAQVAWEFVAESG